MPRDRRTGADPIIPDAARNQTPNVDNRAAMIQKVRGSLAHGNYLRMFGAMFGINPNNLGQDIPTHKAYNQAAWQNFFTDKIAAANGRHNSDSIIPFTYYDMAANARLAKQQAEETTGFGRAIYQEEVNVLRLSVRAVLGEKAEEYLQSTWQDRTLLLSPNVPDADREAAAKKLGLGNLDVLSGCSWIRMDVLRSMGVNEAKDLVKLTPEQLHTLVYHFTSDKCTEIKAKEIADAKEKKNKRSEQRAERTAPVEQVQRRQAPERQEERQQRPQREERQNERRERNSADTARTERRQQDPARQARQETEDGSNRRSGDRQDRREAVYSNMETDQAVQTLIQNISAPEDTVYRQYEDKVRGVRGYYDRLPNARIFDRLVRGAMVSEQKPISIPESGEGFDLGRDYLNNPYYRAMVKIAYEWGRAEGIKGVKNQDQFLKTEINNAIDRIYQSFVIAYGTSGGKAEMRSFFGREIAQLKTWAEEETRASKGKKKSEKGSGSKEKKQKEKKGPTQDNKGPAGGKDASQEANPQEPVCSDIDNSPVVEKLFKSTGVETPPLDDSFYQRLEMRGEKWPPNTKTFDRAVRSALKRGLITIDTEKGMLITGFQESVEHKLVSVIFNEWAKGSQMNPAEMNQSFINNLHFAASRLAEAYQLTAARGGNPVLSDYLGNTEEILVDKLKNLRGSM